MDIKTITEECIVNQYSEFMLYFNFLKQVIKTFLVLSPDLNYWQLHFVYQLSLLQTAFHLVYPRASVISNTLHLDCVSLDTYIASWYYGRWFFPPKWFRIPLPWRLLFLIEAGRFINWSWKHLALPWNSVLSFITWSVLSHIHTTINQRAKMLLI